MNFVKKEIDDLVSVIIPVYNVEKYLDQCVQSVVSQDYQKIEILLINDGSTDGSGDICRKWTEKDNRIVYVQKKNERLGPTRTFGIRMARGKYVMFVDSDDWVEKDFVSELYYSIKKNDGDLAFCDRTDWYGEQPKPKISTLEISGTTNFFENPLILNSISPSMCTKIYSRRLFFENDIVVPPYDNEDFCTLPAILYHAKKITQVKKKLYHYRKDRQESIINEGVGMCRSFPSVIRHSCEYMKENGIWEEMKDYLILHFTKQLFFVFYKSGSRMELKECVTQEYFDDACATMKKYFPSWEDPMLLSSSDFILFGSPDLRSLVMYLDMKASYFSNIFMKRFNFSSLISVFASETIIDEEILNVGIRMEENPYRQEMLRKENEKMLLTVMESMEEKDYFIFDFLEERFDIWEYKGNYRTLNPMNIKLYQKVKDGRIIKRDSVEMENLWKAAVTGFVSAIKKIKSKRIIMYKNFANNTMRDYCSDLSLESVNQILDRYYRELQDRLPEIYVLENERELIQLTAECSFADV